LSPSAADAPAVVQYQRALDEFRRGSRDSAVMLKRMSELISLLDFTTTLGSGLPSDEVLGAALLVVMGELRASRGVLLVRGPDDLYRLRASRGLGERGDAARPLAFAADHELSFRSSEKGGAVFDALGVDLLCPVVKAGRTIALIGLGKRAVAGDYQPEELAFLRAVASCAATPIENGLIYAELRQLNRRLQANVFQLQGLFDISRELFSSFDEDAIQNVATATLLGHLMVSRCALWREVEGVFVLVRERGLRAADGAPALRDADVRQALSSVRGATPVAALPAGALRDRLQKDRMGFLFPISVAGRVQGFFAVGERASGVPFTAEDQDFAMMLGRLSVAALDNVRLHRVRLEKERQDRELQIAREIQRSLFPRRRPTLEGFEVAAESIACQEVGGDYFDFIDVGSRLALVIADVSGKGTPASLLMASVHASLQALAGTASPSLLMERLNRFLFLNTQANKFVTLFYAELEPASRRLAYVNAGHVPPYLVRPGAAPQRLDAGGPVLGLIDHCGYETGEVSLHPGEVLAMVTDGATEARSPEEEEFGDERVVDLLCRDAGRPASEILRSLVEAVAAWTGPAGCGDDLTALVLKVQQA
jgi:sigma-B regulation protein RsbU (phosphoserine phosphatase)